MTATAAAVGEAPRGRPRLAVAARAAEGLALTVLVAAAVAIALAGAAGDRGYLVPALVRARAPWVLGPLAAYGIAEPLRAFWAEVAVMSVGYAAAVVLAPRVRLRWIAAAVVACHAAFLLAPPLLSTDVFNYADAARLEALHHLDPYRSPPAAVRHDPLFVFVHWRHAVTDYGPLFTLGERPLGRLAPDQGVWALKALAAAAGLGCAGVVSWIAQRRGGSAPRAMAAFGLNPVLLVWTVGGAHNDLLMLLALLAGVGLVLTTRPAAGGVLAVAAAAVKLSAGLALPFLLLAARGRRARLRLVAGVAGAIAAVAAVSAAAFPDHALGMVGALERQQALVGIASVPVELAYWLGLPQVTPTELHVLHAALALWLAACLVAVLRGGDVVSAIGWALLGVVVTSTWLLPWYTVWPLAFAAAAGDRRLLIATCAVAITYVVGHVPLA